MVIKSTLVKNLVVKTFFFFDLPLLGELFFLEVCFKETACCDEVDLS